MLKVTFIHHFIYIFAFVGYYSYKPFKSWSFAVIDKVSDLEASVDCDPWRLPPPLGLGGGDEGEVCCCIQAWARLVDGRSESPGVLWNAALGPRSTCQSQGLRHQSISHCALLTSTTARLTVKEWDLQLPARNLALEAACPPCPYYRGRQDGSHRWRKNIAVF